MVALAVMVRLVELAGTAPLTLNVEVEAFTDPKTAEMVEVPAATPVANPAFAPKSWMVAAAALEEFHCTKFVMSC